jgi:hypothetical protein
LDTFQIEGTDPFTAQAYQRRTGRAALPIGFDEIADGALLGRQYDWIVCSFALHLLAPSRLPSVVWQLSRSAPRLLVLTPHKRPDLSRHWGFELSDEFVVQRVRLRAYQRTWNSASTAPG